MHLNNLSREAITNFLFLSDPPSSVDLVIVLGGPSVTSILPALDMFHLGLANQFIISGYGPTKRRPPEWQALLQAALSGGIPGSAILIEQTSRNTYENFLNSELLIRDKIGWDRLSSVAISTQPVHTRRALMTAAHIFPKHIQFLMLANSDKADIQPSAWWQDEYGKLSVLEELRKIGEYGIKGHLGDF
jgi:uncharacterized SAM-binding protein YcdF (DUF218 family)